MTFTLKEQLVVLPQSSVAVYVTTVVPTGKLPPLGMLLVKVAVAVPVVQSVVGTGVVHVATALPAPAPAVKLISAGQVMLILLEPAVTVTSKEHMVVLPQPSVAVYITVDTPIGKLPPLGIALAKFAVAVPVVQLDVGTGVAHVATALLAPAAVVKVISDGQAMLILLAPAVTVTSKEQVVVPPQASVAV